MKSKYIQLAIAVIVIVGSIYYLQAGKVKNSGGSAADAISVVAPDLSTLTTTTSDGATDSIPSGSTTVSTSALMPGSPAATLAASTKAMVIARDAKLPLAKEISTPDGFINTGGNPITIQQYIGKKVVLVDFWTYSCINCQRTTPYLNGWYSKYEKDGLVIIGIHTPEFDFEKIMENVKAAVIRENIKYPVVLDNDYSTWNAYENRFWPRKYLIDINGHIVYDHIGEGGYAETEQEIQKALRERLAVSGLPNTVATSIYTPGEVMTTDQSKVGSSETYFGSDRNEYLANGKKNTAGEQVFTTPPSIDPNKLYLNGTWSFTGESAQNTTAQSSITYKFTAKDVYLVASSDTGVKITVIEDGKVVSSDRGEDVAADGTVTIKENRLYKLIHTADYGTHTLQIIIEKPGLKAFAFTFG